MDDGRRRQRMAIATAACLALGSTLASPAQHVRANPPRQIYPTYPVYPTATAYVYPTPIPYVSPTFTPIVLPSPTASPTATSTGTATPSPTSTSTSTATPTDTPTPTSTASPTAVPTKTSTSSRRAGKTIAARSKGQSVIFNPTSTTIKVGTRVTWVNRSDAPHTVTSTTKGRRFNKSLASRQISFTFRKAGTYVYHCTIHPGMHGTIVVKK